MSASSVLLILLGAFIVLRVVTPGQTGGNLVDRLIGGGDTKKDS